MPNLEIKEAYMVISSKTGKPYLDADNTSFVFTDKKEAENYINRTPCTILEGPRYYKISNMLTQCYAAGAERIRLQIGKQTEDLPLAQNVVDRNYYNNTMNRVLSQLKQTKRKTFLKKFADERFILPVKIKASDDNVEIFYGVAQNGADDSFLYLAFSDLDEYTAWSARIPDWSPLEVGYNTLWRICRHHGVMINPYGNRFILTRKMMEEIKGGADDADQET